MSKNKDLAFEEALGEDWRKDLDITEVPLGERPFIYVGVALVCLGLIVFGRIFYLNVWNGSAYAGRAADNSSEYEYAAAPRGLIVDREGSVLADNRVAWSAILNVRTFLHGSASVEPTLEAAEKILGLSSDDVWSAINAKSAEEFATPVVLNDNLTQSELIALRGLNLPTIKVESDFGRVYDDGPVFSSVLGYIGRVTGGDLTNDKNLRSDDFIGKAGAEAAYDGVLRGQAGVTLLVRDARGRILGEEKKNDPQIGRGLKLTIDGGLQRYFYSRMLQGLQVLGRTSGVGLAMNPQTGEILALINFPTYDNNIFNSTGHSSEIASVLNSPLNPLFDRAVAGFYNPGSTIKPLVGVAALREGVIDTTREIYSSGYLLVPNPYDLNNIASSSRYLDWQYQGNVNLYSALAQSSDVYFYIVGGGSPSMSTPPQNDPSDYGVSGLGISRLHAWWQKFGLGERSGIDLPHEAAGFLPTPDWKTKKTGRPWLLGDTYNVSIGQGDLLLTPIQLLDYISAIANGGKILRPVINTEAAHPTVNIDLTSLAPEISEVQKGMEEAVTSPRGTAHSLADLGFPVAAKTGSAQINNNAQENAFFVGYAPTKNSQIAILVLVENSLQGSLNAVPIAKDVLSWYYWNRLNKQ